METIRVLAFDPLAPFPSVRGGPVSPGSPFLQPMPGAATFFFWPAPMPFFFRVSNPYHLFFFACRFLYGHGEDRSIPFFLPPCPDFPLLRTLFCRKTPHFPKDPPFPPVRQSSNFLAVFPAGASFFFLKLWDVSPFCGSLGAACLFRVLQCFRFFSFSWCRDFFLLVTFSSPHSSTKFLCFPRWTPFVCAITTHLSKGLFRDSFLDPSLRVSNTSPLPAFLPIFVLPEGLSPKKIEPPLLLVSWDDLWRSRCPSVLCTFIRIHG